MSRSEVDRFLATLETDAGLAQEFAHLAGDLEAAVRWANARGYDFTRQEAAALDRAGELSDDELDMAAGGWTDPTQPDPSSTTGS